MKTPEQFTGGSSDLEGRVRAVRIRDLGTLPSDASPQPGLLWRLKNLWQHRRGLPPLAAALTIGRVFGVVSVRANLAGKLFRPDFSRLDLEQWQRLQALLKANVDVNALVAAFGGRVWDYGLLSTRLFTNTGAGFIVDAFQNLVELENMKFHGIGTGSVAEAAGDTALGTELTTEYNPDNTRATGSTTEASAQVYRTVGTNTVDTAPAAAIREHGIFSQAATGGGVLLDRSVFAAITLAANDSLQTTYDLTVNSGN